MKRLLSGSLVFCLLGFAVAQENKIPDWGYKVVSHWPTLPSGFNFGETTGVDLDSRGHVYVFNRSAHPIMEFDGSGKFVRSLGEGLFQRTHGLRVDRENNLWAVDVGAHVVLKMSPEGRILMVLGRRGMSAADPDPPVRVQFNQPTDVAFGPAGEIYVSDGYGNSRVVKFSPDGKLLLAWGQKGTGPGEFNLPHAVAVDARGRVYVGDRENRRLQIFDSNGKFIAEWKQAGSPWGLDITPDQHIYVADGYANRILVLNTEGQILGSIGGPGKMPGDFSFAHAVAVSGGDVYTAEILNWRAQKFVKR